MQLAGSVYAKQIKSHRHLPQSSDTEQHRCCVALEIRVKFRLLLLESTTFMTLEMFRFFYYMSLIPSNSSPDLIQRQIKSGTKWRCQISVLILHLISLIAVTMS